jgi:hypothetical protein
VEYVGLLAGELKESRHEMLPTARSATLNMSSKGETLRTILLSLARRPCFDLTREFLHFIVFSLSDVEVQAHKLAYSSYISASYMVGNQEPRYLLHGWIRWESMFARVAFFVSRSSK